MTEVKHQEGLTLRLKKALHVRELRFLRRAFNWVAWRIPYPVKYGVGTAIRRKRFPYAVIRPGDVVVQIGAPRDLVKSGRSRAVHFARLVGNGKVVVLEPDPDSVKALEAFFRDNGLANRAVVVAKGAWSSLTNLEFLSSDEHPASNLLAEYEVDVVKPDDYANRGYKRILVPVDTVDNLLRNAGVKTPRLISITTNGAEREILAGMTEVVAAGCEYISLAVTATGYIEAMAEIGYELVSHDDRGFTFRRKIPQTGAK